MTKLRKVLGASENRKGAVHDSTVTANRSSQQRNLRKSKAGVLGSAQKQGLAVRRPFAVFDIDGTIIRWQLYHAIADSLADGGHIDPDLFAEVKKARMQWKKRTHKDSFNEYEKALVKTYDKALATLSFDDFMASVHAAFDEYKNQTYTYTRDLISSLKAKNYLLFAISASQTEIVEMLAKHYGFDAWAGSIYVRHGNKFTGQKIPLRSNLKVGALQKLVDKFGATYKDSIAVGDSDSDIPMLELVEQPITFNPDKKLFAHARRQSWKIVVERKNVIYELEPKDGSYVLV